MKIISWVPLLLIGFLTALHVQRADACAMCVSASTCENDVVSGYRACAFDCSTPPFCTCYTPYPRCHYVSAPQLLDAAPKLVAANMSFGSTGFYLLAQATGARPDRPSTSCTASPDGRGGVCKSTAVNEGALIRFNVSASILEQVMEFDLDTAYALYEFSRLSRRSMGVDRDLTELVIAVTPTRPELSAAAAGRPLTRSGDATVPPPNHHKRYQFAGLGDTSNDQKLTFKLIGVPQLGVSNRAAPIEVQLERDASDPNSNFKVVQWRPAS